MTKENWLDPDKRQASEFQAFGSAISTDRTIHFVLPVSYFDLLIHSKRGYKDILSANSATGEGRKWTRLLTLILSKRAIHGALRKDQGLH